MWVFACSYSSSVMYYTFSHIEIITIQIKVVETLRTKNYIHLLEFRQDWSGDFIQPIEEKISIFNFHLLFSFFFFEEENWIRVNMEKEMEKKRKKLFTHVSRRYAAKQTRGLFCCFQYVNLFIRYAVLLSNILLRIQGGSWSRFATAGGFIFRFVSCRFRKA